MKMGSLKAVGSMKRRGENFFFARNALGGDCRGRMTMMEKLHMAKEMNPMIRTVHPNPMRGCRPWKTNGYNVAPRLLPTVAKAIARARRLMKYFGTTAMEGIWRQHVPRPMQMPCASSTCQYSVLMLVIMNPNVTKKVPVTTSALQYPASYSGPTKTLSDIRQKTWIEPIQDIADAEESLRSWVS